MCFLYFDTLDLSDQNRAGAPSSLCVASFEENVNHSEKEMHYHFFLTSSEKDSLQTFLKKQHPAVKLRSDAEDLLDGLNESEEDDGEKEESGEKHEEVHEPITLRELTLRKLEKLQKNEIKYNEFLKKHNLRYGTTPAEVLTHKAILHIYEDLGIPRDVYKKGNAQRVMQQSKRPPAPAHPQAAEGREYPISGRGGSKSHAPENTNTDPETERANQFKPCPGVFKWKQNLHKHAFPILFENEDLTRCIRKMKQRWVNLWVLEETRPPLFAELNEASKIKGKIEADQNDLIFTLIGLSTHNSKNWRDDRKICNKLPLEYKIYLRKGEKEFDMVLAPSSQRADLEGVIETLNKPQLNEGELKSALAGVRPDHLESFLGRINQPHKPLLQKVSKEKLINIIAENYEDKRQDFIDHLHKKMEAGTEQPR